MGAFNTDFVTTGPVGSDLANQIDVYIRQDAKAAIDERLTLEHYSLEDGVADDAAAGGQGRHKAGYVGALLLDTEANILAISTAGIGAIGLTTDTGLLYCNTATGWEIQQFGTGTLYASDTEAAAGTEEEKSINPKQLQSYIWVPAFKAITGHTTYDVTQESSSGGISAITFSLDEFTGDTDLDLTKANTLLVDILITGESDSADGEYMYMYATTDTLGSYTICGSQTLHDNQSAGMAGRMEIPLFSADTEITLEIASNLSQSTGLYYGYTIAGVIQREYTV